MELVKENVLQDVQKMVEQSWTYGRMTREERGRCIACLQEAVGRGSIKGNYRARWNHLCDIYSAFLDGLGYDGPFWREDKAADAPTF